MVYVRLLNVVNKYKDYHSKVVMLTVKPSRKRDTRLMLKFIDQLQPSGARKCIGITSSFMSFTLKYPKLWVHDC